MKTQNATQRTWPVRGHHTFRLQVKDVEVPKGASMTVQDDSYTVREIMEKFTIQGETWDEKQGLFQDEVSHESQDLRRVMTLDLVDRDELLSEAQLKAHMATQKLLDIKRQVDKENEAKVKEQAIIDELKRVDVAKLKDTRKSESFKAKTED